MNPQTLKYDIDHFSSRPYCHFRAIKSVVNTTCNRRFHLEQDFEFTTVKLLISPSFLRESLWLKYSALFRVRWYFHKFCHSVGSYPFRLETVSFYWKYEMECMLLHLSFSLTISTNTSWKHSRRLVVSTHWRDWTHIDRFKPAKCESLTQRPMLDIE